MKKKPEHIYLIQNKAVKNNTLFSSEQMFKGAKVLRPFTLNQAIERREELKYSVGNANKKIKIYKLVEMKEKEIKELMRVK